jgi:hypothetical protein
MSSSKLRSDDRQRLRAKAQAAVADLPIPYVLEAVAKRLDVSHGRFEVSVHHGFLEHVIRRSRWFEYRDLDGRWYRQFGDEKLIPAGLWERPLRVSTRIVWHGCERVLIKGRS